MSTSEPIPDRTGTLYMALIKQRVCDVLATQQNKMVAATDTARVVVPAAATPTGKPARIDVDVSHQGKQMLGKMVREAEEATARAWAPLLALKPQKVEKATKAEKKAEPEQDALDERTDVDDVTTPAASTADDDTEWNN